MAPLYHLVYFLAFLVSCHSLDSGVFLQLDGCALENIVTGVLSNKDFLIKKMSESPATKKALGKKGKSPVKGITNIKVEKIDFSNIELDFLPNLGVHMFVTNKIEIGGKSFLGGRTELKLEINIITNSTLKKENVTCPTLRVSECRVEVLNVKANLPKGILPNVMNNFLDKNLKTILPNTACPAVDYILTEVNKKLCIQEVDLPIENIGNLRYLLTPVPTVTGEHFEMELNVTLLKGEEVVDPPERTNNPLVLPSNPQTTTLILKASFLGYFFTLLQQEGLFNFKTTEDDITNAGAISTSVLSDIIPELPPGLQDYKINIYVKKTPLVTISTSKALLHLYSTMEVVASSPDSEPSLLFVIDLHMNYKIQSSVKENSLHSMFSLDKTFLSVNASSVGDFEVQDLNDFINSVLKEVYSPVINGLTQTAIPLPDIKNMLDMDFSNAEIEIDKDLLLLSINICNA
ncbi:BPI fold-containing family B member 6-like [Rana temporaria]|uniref:BPI fold-containing family B member 6-like n=1 Tax=Rana temporaria TaxID=8407 RepID=UPI001AADADAE|nr:BPI fold-containing family B member 6-like [Rana temporaria]